MADTERPDPPSPFVVEWADRLSTRLPAPRRALDVAMGRGRHAQALAARGYRVFGVDRRQEIVRDAVERARRRGLPIRGWAADLEGYPLPLGRFELIVVTRYLQRDLFPALCDALTPGGAVVYETFTTAQRGKGWGPASPAHLLEPGELRSRLDGLEVIFYEEVNEAEAVARLVGMQRISAADSRSGAPLTC
jgi:SAM-dependent methyltransferase